MIKTPNIKPRS